MNINVDSLNNDFSRQVEFETCITLPESDSYDEQVLVSCNGTITNSHGKYTFDGQVAAKVVFYCSSCLEKFEEELSFPMIEVFSKETLEDDEMWAFSGKNNISLEEPEYELTELNDDEAFEGFDDIDELEEIPSIDDSSDDNNE